MCTVLKSRVRNKPFQKLLKHRVTNMSRYSLCLQGQMSREENAIERSHSRSCLQELTYYHTLLNTESNLSFLPFINTLLLE